MVYLFLSTGVALVKSNCICADNTQISFYDISNAESGIHTNQNCCDKSLSDSENNKDNERDNCGCELPVVTYLKLTDHPGSVTKFEYPAGKTILIVYFPEELLLIENVTTNVEIVPNYSPPEKPYGRILISFLNQRKIALTA